MCLVESQDICLVETRHGRFRKLPLCYFLEIFRSIAFRAGADKRYEDKLSDTIGIEAAKCKRTTILIESGVKIALRSSMPKVKTRNMKIGVKQ